MKRNPTKWKEHERIEDRYFTSPKSIELGFDAGTIDQHIVIENSSGLLSFGASTVRLILDNPGRLLQDGSDAYSSAVERLSFAAVEGQVELEVVQRECERTCGCRNGHPEGYQVISAIDQEF